MSENYIFVQKLRWRAPTAYSVFCARQRLMSTLNEFFTIARFFRNLAKTRSIIERTFGLWKMRFRCLDTLRVKDPTYAAEIIKATAILHNFIIRMRLEQENDDDEFI
jgi:hypothetical protein